MSDFLYQAKDASGANKKGTITAVNEAAALEVLQNKQLFVLSITEVVASDINKDFMRLLNRVKSKDITFFSRQLSVMINASIPVVKALKTIADQTENPYFRELILEVASDVDGGIKLSVAMYKHPKVFDQFFVQMVRSGETTGRLDSVLSYLANQKEQDYDVQNRIRGALIYPAVIIAVMIVIAVLMLVYVIPRITEVIEQSGQEVPWTTQILISSSAFISSYWWIIILLGLLATLGVYVFARTPQGRYYLDVLKLRLPVFGKLNRKIILTRFSISFSNLLASGVPVTKSLEISGDVVNNTVINEIVKRAIIEVEAGNPISKEFVNSKYIPLILPQMMSVGEETGQLDEVLEKLARFYAKEVESSIAALTSLVEPLIIVVLGIGALFLVAGILMPIYGISNAIS